MQGKDLIKHIISSSERYNLHSHTEFCDGRAQMEAFARKAAEQRFDWYGFSPHSPISIPSSCNMLRDNVSRYLDEVRLINLRHADSGVKFLASMEIDFLNAEDGPSADFFQQIPLDYRIGSVHFIPVQDNSRYVDIDGSHETFARKLHEDFNDDLRYIVEKYYEQSILMVRLGGFDIIGHFDKIGDNASSVSPDIEDLSWYQALVDDLISAIADNGCFAEINTKVYAKRQRFYPHQKRWEKILDKGIPFVINSDAHYPHLIDAGRSDALRFLKEIHPPR